MAYFTTPKTSGYTTLQSNGFQKMRRRSTADQACAVKRM